MKKGGESKQRHFFITGCYRSGTTLVDKFLSNHRNCLAFSQPLTSLFIQTKQIFYREYGVHSKKYLGLGAPSAYDLVQWDDFMKFSNVSKLSLLSLQQVSETILKEFTSEVSGFDPFPSNFSSLYLSLLKIIGRRSEKTLTALGVKEIICHEYMPCFLNSGIKVVLIIRDPRQVIESLNFGAGDKFTGGIRPTLLNLHNWREVAEIGLRNQSHANLMLIRYEDFIRDPDLRLKLLEFLELSPNEIDLRSLKQIDGTIWSSNSSFTDKGRTNLDDSISRYVEAVCFFEMQKLGYQTEIEMQAIPEMIESFREPWIVAPRDYYETNYSTQVLNINFELERWGMKMSDKNRENSI